MRRDVPAAKRARPTTRLLTETCLSTPTSRLAVEVCRSTRLGSNILLALGTMTLAGVMAPDAAQAQCNSSINPAPPSPVVANFSNKTFGNNPPLVPYNVTSFGLVGCNGADGGSGESGQPGSPGQPGAQISSTNSALTIIGGFSAQTGSDTFGAPIVSFGGNGGTGGQLIRNGDKTVSTGAPAGGGVHSTSNGHSVGFCDRLSAAGPTVTGLQAYSRSQLAYGSPTPLRNPASASAAISRSERWPPSGLLRRSCRAIAIIRLHAFPRLCR